MAVHRVGEDYFEVHRNMIDVTSYHRPDTDWTYIDKAGHEHRWFADGAPAKTYSPSATHDVPSLVWVKDGEEYWEDEDEPHPFGHHECRLCSEHIQPRYTADTYTQYIPGLMHCSINGEPVSREEFERRYAESQQSKPPHGA